MRGRGTRWCLRLQMTSTEEDLLSLDHYVRKTFHKTASLMANSCKAIAILGGQNKDVAQLAWEYGRHVGLSFQASHCTNVSPHVPQGICRPVFNIAGGARVLAALSSLCASAAAST